MNKLERYQLTSTDPLLIIIIDMYYYPLFAAF